MMTPSPAKSVISVSSARTVRPMQLTSLFTTASFRAQSRDYLAVGAVELDVEHHAQALPVAARSGAADELYVLRLQPCHEALGADVDAEQGYPHAQGLPRDMQEGTVPAEGDYELRLLRRAAQRDHVRVPRHVHKHRGDNRLAPVELQQLLCAVGEDKAAVAVGVRGQDDFFHHFASSLWDAATISAASGMGASKAPFLR